MECWVLWLLRNWVLWGLWVLQAKPGVTREQPLAPAPAPAEPGSVSPMADSTSAELPLDLGMCQAFLVTVATQPEHPSLTDRITLVDNRGSGSLVQQVMAKPLAPAGNSGEQRGSPSVAALPAGPATRGSPQVGAGAGVSSLGAASHSTSVPLAPTNARHGQLLSFTPTGHAVALATGSGSAGPATATSSPAPSVPTVRRTSKSPPKSSSTPKPAVEVFLDSIPGEPVLGTTDPVQEGTEAKPLLGAVSALRRAPPAPGLSPPVGHAPVTHPVSGIQASSSVADKLTDANELVELTSAVTAEGPPETAWTTVPSLPRDEHSTGMSPPSISKGSPEQHATSVLLFQEITPGLEEATSPPSTAASISWDMDSPVKPAAAPASPAAGLPRSPPHTTTEGARIATSPSADPPSASSAKVTFSSATVGTSEATEPETIALSSTSHNALQDPPMPPAQLSPALHPQFPATVPGTGESHPPRRGVAPSAAADELPGANAVTHPQGTTLAPETPAMVMDITAAEHVPTTSFAALGSADTELASIRSELSARATAGNTVLETKATPVGLNMGLSHHTAPNSPGDPFPGSLLLQTPSTGSGTATAEAAADRSPITRPSITMTLSVTSIGGAKQDRSPQATLAPTSSLSRYGIRTRPAVSIVSNTPVNEEGMGTASAAGGNATTMLWENSATLAAPKASPSHSQPGPTAGSAPLGTGVTPGPTPASPLGAGPQRGAAPGAETWSPSTAPGIGMAVSGTPGVPRATTGPVALQGDVPPLLEGSPTAGMAPQLSPSSVPLKTAAGTSSLLVPTPLPAMGASGDPRSDGSTVGQVLGTVSPEVSTKEDPGASAAPVLGTSASGTAPSHMIVTAGSSPEPPTRGTDGLNTSSLVDLLLLAPRHSRSAPSSTPDPSASPALASPHPSTASKTPQPATPLLPKTTTSQGSGDRSPPAGDDSTTQAALGSTLVENTRAGAMTGTTRTSDTAPETAPTASSHTTASIAAWPSAAASDHSYRTAEPTVDMDMDVNKDMASPTLGNRVTGLPLRLPTPVARLAEPGTGDATMVAHSALGSKSPVAVAIMGTVSPTAAELVTARFPGLTHSNTEPDVSMPPSLPENTHLMAVASSVAEDEPSAGVSSLSVGHINAWDTTAASQSGTGGTTTQGDTTSFERSAEGAAPPASISNTHVHVYNAAGTSPATVPAASMSHSNTILPATSASGDAFVVTETAAALPSATAEASSTSSALSPAVTRDGVGGGRQPVLSPAARSPSMETTTGSWDILGPSPAFSVPSSPLPSPHSPTRESETATMGTRSVGVTQGPAATWTHSEPTTGSTAPKSVTSPAMGQAASMSPPSTRTMLGVPAWGEKTVIAGSSTAGSTIGIAEGSTAGSTTAVTAGSTTAIAADSTEAIIPSGSSTAITADSTAAISSGSSFNIPAGSSTGIAAGSTAGSSTEAITSGTTRTITVGSTVASTPSNDMIVTTGSTTATAAGSTMAIAAGNTTAIAAGSTTTIAADNTEAVITAGSTRAVTAGNSAVITSGSTRTITADSTRAITADSTFDIAEGSTVAITPSNDMAMTAGSTTAVTADITTAVTVDSTTAVMVVTAGRKTAVATGSTTAIAADSTEAIISAGSIRVISAGSTRAITADSTKTIAAGSTVAITPSNDMAMTAGSTRAITADSTKTIAAGSTVAITPSNDMAMTADSTTAVTADSTTAITAGSTTAITAGRKTAIATGSTVAITAGSTTAIAADSTEAIITAGSSTAITADSTRAITADSTTAISAGSTFDITAGSGTAITAGSGTAITADSTTDIAAGSTRTIAAGSTLAITPSNDMAITAGSTTAVTTGRNTAVADGSTMATTAGSTTAIAADSTEAIITAGSTRAVTAGNSTATTAVSTRAIAADSTRAITAGSTFNIPAGSSTGIAAGTIAGSTEAITAGSTVAITPNKDMAVTAESTIAITPSNATAITAGSTMAVTAGSTTAITPSNAAVITASTTTAVAAGSTTAITPNNAAAITASTTTAVTAGSTMAITPSNAMAITADSTTAVTAGSTTAIIPSNATAIPAGSTMAVAPTAPASPVKEVGGLLAPATVALGRPPATINPATAPAFGTQRGPATAARTSVHTVTGHRNPTSEPQPTQGFLMPAASLYPFGTEEGDQEYIQRTVDFNSPLFKPEIGFPFGKSLRDALYEYSTLSSTRDPLVRDVEAKIEKYLKILYIAKWTLKVTWEKAPAYPSRLDDTRTNTYQAVLTTDGNRSFALLLYQDGRMRWDYTELAAGNVLMGFSSGDGYAQNNELSQKPRAVKYRPDQHSSTGTDVRGLWIYRLDSRSRVNYRLQCLTWLDAQPAPDTWNSELPPCPCSRPQAELDPRYRQSRGPADASMRMLRTTSPSPAGAGVRCLYQDGSLLEGWQERAWSLPIHPGTDEELEAFDWCCRRVGKPLFCARFAEKRPKVNCEGYVPPTPASAFGDPHITTLDGLNYTFNGLGDFVLLVAGDAQTSFVLQGRTAQTGTAQATSFVAFAAQYVSTTTATVEWTLGSQGDIQVLLNDETIWFSYSQDLGADVYYSPGVLLVNDSSITAIFDGAISISISAVSGILSMVCNLPDRYRNSTKGLLGVWDHDPADDFQMPNGTSIPVNSSEEEIYSYGLTWTVGEHSLFAQPLPSLLTNFTPVFLSQLQQENESLYQLAALQCHGSRECIYDALSTGDMALGLATQSLAADFQQKKVVLNAFPPVIIGDTSLTAFRAERVRRQYRAVGMGAHFIPHLSPDLNISESGTLTWEPHELSPLTVNLEAVGSNNLSALLQLRFTLCSCSRSQECDYSNTVTLRGSSLQLAACRCEGGYSGPFCQDLPDPCAQGCFPGVNCDSHAGCGPCPAGLTGDGRHCSDINECAQGTACPGNSTCTNTVGSYSCSCPDGEEGEDLGCGSACGSRSCPEGYCSNGGHCHLHPITCAPTCTCPPAFTDQHCLVAGGDFWPLPSADLPRRSVRLRVRTLWNATAGEVNGTVSAILGSLEVKAFQSNTNITQMTESDGFTFVVVSEFAYDSRSTVIQFLNKDLLGAITSAFNGRRGRREVGTLLLFQRLHRDNITDLVKLTVAELRPYFPCGLYGYKGYQLHYVTTTGFICISPCKMGYCQHGGHCQHLPEGPTCSCLPFSIFSPAGARCEQLAISLAAFLGILVGALVLLCLLLSTACLASHLCRRHHHWNRGTKETFWRSRTFSSLTMAGERTETPCSHSLERCWEPQLPAIDPSVQIRIQRPHLRPLNQPPQQP
ncbi:mucin-4 isoform X3 [Patagioenas fasciata]|uniref:mucin-4 isoform X3 n=1 Tax=Patagioenas fasciata TaxID=372321 RepID=UPI003A99AA3F